MQSNVTAEKLKQVISNKKIESLVMSVEGCTLLIDGINFDDGSSCSIISKGEPIIESIENSDGSEIWITRE